MVPDPNLDLLRPKIAIHLRRRMPHWGGDCATLTAPRRLKKVGHVASCRNRAVVSMRPGRSRHPRSRSAWRVRVTGTGRQIFAVAHGLNLGIVMVSIHMSSAQA